MLTQQLIDKIHAQLQSLKEQTAALDERNRYVRSDRFKYRDIFNTQLFRCESTELLDYVIEAEQNFHTLLNGGQYAAHLNALGEKLTDQIAALSQALRSNEVARKELKYQRSQSKKRYSQKNKNQNKNQQAAKFFMKNSHQLHQELAENLEFERRLNEMIFERQAKMQQASQQTASHLQREILALHQRLGKCRRAITAVEERIQLSESKNKA